MRSESKPIGPEEGESDWLARREAPTFREGIDLLEHSHISGGDKVQILAVSLALKKAATISVQPELVSSSEMVDIFTKLGVPYFRDHEAERDLRMDYMHRGIDDREVDMEYVIAESQEALEAIQGIERSRLFGENEGFDRSYGRAVEYPETAIEAWDRHMWDGDKDALLPQDDSNLTEEERAFLWFRLSREHWEEEVPWVEQIIAGVKEYSPAVYAEVMQSYRQRGKL